MDQLEKRNRADLYPSFVLNHALRNVACNKLLRAISFPVFTVFFFIFMSCGSEQNRPTFLLPNTRLKNLLNSIDFSPFEHKLINLKH